MIAVIFEAEPAEGESDAYLELGAAMSRALGGIDGFLSVERFQSLTTPGKLLSLSFFRDEAAVERWRTMAAHRAAQERGRGRIFADYRLRVAAVLRDYGKYDRREAPADSRAAHDMSG